MSIARYVKFWEAAEKFNPALRTRRNIISAWVAVLSAGLFILSIAYVSDTRHFMPGPITMSHGTLEQCTDCHTNVSKGQFGWLRAIVAPVDHDKDTKACVSCHMIGDGARNPHSLELARLDAYVKRAEASPEASKRSTSARVREAALPVDQTFPDGVPCATCHKEHNGQLFNLKSMADTQCHTCHSVQFNDFHTSHPEFDSYPFRRRTRINFDHTGHFKKHFPEWRTKKNAKQVPPTCTNCHTATAEVGYMDIKPFAEICSSCHIDQITGKERATGPKGITLLSLPGLDLETLKEKNADVGEWPEDAEGEISPLMRLLIGRDDAHRKTLKVTDELDLLDLTEATDEQIAEVRKLALEVKRLFYALTTDGMSDFFRRIKSATGARISQDLATQLSASMPLDVLLAAQREWLPSLVDEIEATPSAAQEEKDDTAPVFATDASPSESADDGALEDDASDEEKPKPVSASPADASANWRIDPFGRLIKGNQLPEEDDEEENESDEEAAEQEGDDPDAETDTADADAGETDESSEIDVDTEDWTELGGWYRKDFAILYKPVGHADPFLRAWLDLTSRLYSGNENNVAKPAFEELTGKDAQGQCMKCHSVDATRNASRLVNWEPSSPVSNESPFTKFDHRPHFGVAQKEGCFTCHGMSKAKGYLETYKGNDPYKYVPNFKLVKKETCASCHGKMQVRQDCLLCHKYHVNEVASPVMTTKIPQN
ncbi:MAG: hypothetical protein MPJ78_13530 [Hyphomicrobiaceae bacterium]|nr:hypothetical protein [Hyphomicrobiaceae bacterium]